MAGRFGSFGVGVPLPGETLDRLMFPRSVGADLLRILGQGVSEYGKEREAAADKAATLALQRERLAEDKRQFDEGLSFKERALQHEKRGDEMVPVYEDTGEEAGDTPDAGQEPDWAGPFRAEYDATNDPKVSPAERQARTSAFFKSHPDLDPEKPYKGYEGRAARRVVEMPRSQIPGYRNYLETRRHHGAIETASERSATAAEGTREETRQRRMFDQRNIEEDNRRAADELQLRKDENARAIAKEARSRGDEVAARESLSEAMIEWHKRTLGAPPDAGTVARWRATPSANLEKIWDDLRAQKSSGDSAALASEREARMIAEERRRASQWKQEELGKARAALAGITNPKTGQVSPGDAEYANYLQSQIDTLQAATIPPDVLARIPSRFASKAEAQAFLDKYRASFTPQRFALLEDEVAGRVLGGR